MLRFGAAMNESKSYARSFVRSRLSVSARLFPILLASVLTVFAGCSKENVRGVTPLTGTDRIFDTRQARFVGRAALFTQLADADFVLLGETHDNPHHHRLQNEVLEGLAERKRRPAVAFEMIPSDRQADIDAFLSTRPEDIGKLGDVIAWEKSGWPDWGMYAPLVTTAVENAFPVVAADVPRNLLQRVRHEGFAALPPERQKELGLDTPLTPELAQALEDEIRDAHCGYATPAMLDRMLPVQRLRDAWLAERLVAGAADDGAVLIAGKGHTRTDRAVPAVLARMRPQAAIIAVGFVEATDELDETRLAELPWDYVWLTEAGNTEDPCERFRESLEKMKRSKG